jgi:hypothetical protein
MQDSTAVFRAFDRDGSGSIRCTLARTGTAFASSGAGCNPAAPQFNGVAAARGGLLA